MNTSTVWKKINENTKFNGPGFKAAHSSEIIDNKMYVFGGWNGKKALSDLHVYNYITEAWSEPEVTGNKPGHRNNHATSTYNHYMFLHGGHNGEIWQDDLFIFDTQGLVWNKIVFNSTSYIPSARACHTLNLIDDKLYMVGGYDGTKCYSDVDIYCINKKEWTIPMISGKVPLARNAHTVTTIGNKLYLYGGHSGNKHLKDMHVLNVTKKNGQK